MRHTIQFPSIMPVQLGFKLRLYPLGYEEERMVFRFGQFIRYYRIIHKKPR